MTHVVFGIVTLLQTLEAFVVFTSVVGDGPVVEGDVGIVRVVAINSRLRDMVANPPDSCLQIRRAVGVFPLRLCFAEIRVCAMRVGSVGTAGDCAAERVDLKHKARHREHFLEKSP